MVDNRYTGVGYEPSIECANCADLTRQLAEATKLLKILLSVKMTDSNGDVSLATSETNYKNAREFLVEVEE